MNDWQIGYMTGLLVGIIATSGLWITVELLKDILAPPARHASTSEPKEQRT